MGCQIPAGPKAPRQARILLVIGSFDTTSESKLFDESRPKPEPKVLELLHRGNQAF